MDLAAEREVIECSIVEAVRGIVGGEASVHEDTNLAELGIDSLRLVELTLALEQRWTIELRPDDYDGIKTVGDIVSLIAEAKPTVW